MNETAWSFFQNAAELITEYIQESTAERHTAKELYIQQTQAAQPTLRGNNSWADIARAAQGGHPRAAQPTTPTVEDTKKAKQVTVRIEDLCEKAQMAEASLSQLVQTFQGGGGKAEEIIAARRTAGGDIILQTATVQAREELERED